MKKLMTLTLTGLVVAGAIALLVRSNRSNAVANGTPSPVAPSGLRSIGAAGLPEAQLVPLKLELPRPCFIGTRQDIRDSTVDPKSADWVRGAFYVPTGVELLSRNKPVKLSDSSPSLGTADIVTDGDKEAQEGSRLEMGPGLQWVQVDLGQSSQVWAILLWHCHAEQRVYRDVVVQVSDDPDFISGVTTMFNNDDDNSAGLGLGREREYFETHQGKLVDGGGIKARYVRCYSNGFVGGSANHFVEVEVWGRK